MATKLSQIHPSPYSSHQTNPTTKDTFNYSTRSFESNPVRRPMHQAPHQRERMAHPQTKPQQAGSRRTNHITHNQENSIRSSPGRARAVPETPRKPHRQNWEQGDANLMKSLPRQPKQRKPFHDVNYNSKGRTALREPRQQRASGSGASTESLHAQNDLSNMYTMIDDHLAWNMYASDLTHHRPESPRPSSSGTMFIDFGSNGEVEVSYRNGVNKKLPTPPVPPKIPAPSKSTALRQATGSKTKPQRGETKQAKPGPKLLPPHPSQSSRHDSIMTPGAEQIGLHSAPPFPPPNRPLPTLPNQNPPSPQSRKSYPPQVHTTRTASTTKATHHCSPALSTTSTTTYHTTRDVEARGESNDAAYTVIEPEDPTAPYYSHRLATRFTADPRPLQQTSHPSSRSASLAPSRTDTYKGSPSPSAYAHSSKSAPLKRKDTNKPLPPLPPGTRDFAHRDTQGGVSVAPRSEPKRRKVLAFVKKVLRKMGDVSDEFIEHQHQYERVERRR